MFCFLILSFLHYRELLRYLQDIEKGKHNDKRCKEYCNEYKELFGQKLPKCQFKDNRSKIQNLIRKVHIDKDGSVTDVHFANKGTTSLRTKMKNLFRRK